MEYLELAMNVLLYVSFFLCLVGGLFVKKTAVRIYFFVLLAIEIYSEILSYNLELLLLCYITHLLFLSYVFIQNKFVAIHAKDNRVKLFLGVLVSSQLLIAYSGLDSYHYWARISTNFIIVVCSFMYFIRLYLDQVGVGTREKFLVNSAIFLFFGIDLFFAITSDFLYTTHLNLAAGFWFFRALLLQLYYLAIILFIGKLSVNVFKQHTINLNEQ